MPALGLGYTARTMSTGAEAATPVGPPARARRCAWPGHPDGDGAALRGRYHPPQRRSEAGGQGGHLRAVRGRPLLRALGLSDHRPASWTPRAGRTTSATSTPAVRSRIFPLYYAVLAAFFLVARLFTTPYAADEQARTTGLAVELRLQLLPRAGKGDFGPPVLQPLLVAGRRGALLPALAAGRAQPSRNQTLERLCVAVGWALWPCGSSWQPPAPARCHRRPHPLPRRRALHGRPGRHPDTRGGKRRAHAGALGALDGGDARAADGAVGPLLEDGAGLAMRSSSSCVAPCGPVLRGLVADHLKPATSVLARALPQPDAAVRRQVQLRPVRVPRASLPGTSSRRRSRSGWTPPSATTSWSWWPRRPGGRGSRWQSR